MRDGPLITPDTVSVMHRTPPPEPRPLVTPRGWLVMGVVAALLVTIGIVLWSRPHTFAGTPVDPPSPAPDLSSLTLHTGEIADLERFEGSVILLSFAYTHCPDVCPRALTLLAGTMDELDDRAADVDVMVVGIDPERDGPRDLGRYVTSFDPRFLGAVGTEAEVRSVAEDFGVLVRRIPIEGGYVFEQSATIAVIGPSGDLRLFVGLDVAPEALADDVRELLP